MGNSAGSKDSIIVNIQIMDPLNSSMLIGDTDVFKKML